MADRVRMVRLLVVSSRFHPTVGGAERQGLELAVALRARHVPVAVVTLHDPRRGARCGFKPVPIFGVDFPKLKFAGPFLAYLRGILVLRRLAARRPAAAQLQTLDPFTLALGLASIAMRLPLIVRISGAFEMNLGYLSPKREIRAFIARWMLRRASRVIALNSEIDQRLVELGVRPERILRTPNAIPDRFFSIARTPDRAAAACVLQMGRLDHFKGGEIMLRAWQFVARAHQGAVLNFVGEGPERSRLERLAHELEIEHRVVFWGSSAETDGFYSSADVLVLPSLMEGMPNVLLEAMASGLPCVASDLPGTRDIIEHEYTGLLVPPGSPLPLAAAVIRLLTDEGVRKSLGQAARERVKPWAMSRLAGTHVRLHTEICGI